MESAIDKERRTFEAHVIRVGDIYKALYVRNSGLRRLNVCFQEAEKRVASYRRSCAVVQQQMERDRTQFQDAVNDMCDTVR